MAGTKGEGKGWAGDAEVATLPAGEESPEEHEAAIREVRREQADAAVEGAKAALEKVKGHLAGAEKALKDAEAHRAKLGDE